MNKLNSKCSVILYGFSEDGAAFSGSLLVFLSALLELVPGDDDDNACGVFHGRGVVGGRHKVALVASLLVNVAHCIIEQTPPVLYRADRSFQEFQAVKAFLRELMCRKFLGLFSTSVSNDTVECLVSISGIVLAFEDRKGDQLMGLDV